MERPTPFAIGVSAVFIKTPASTFVPKACAKGEFLGEGFSRLGPINKSHPTCASSTQTIMAGTREQLW